MSLEELRAKAAETISEPDLDPVEEGASVEAKEEEVAAPVEAAESEAPAEESTVEQDPPRVPYSRFESVNEARIRAEEQLALFQRREEEERLTRAAASNEQGLPNYWTQLYGDSPESKQAYALRQQEISEMREQLQESVRQELINEQRQTEERTEDMVDDWSNQISDYARENKRKFTDSQTDALLDVMDELTPKDTQGNYLVEPIDYLERAVELFDLRQEKAMASKKTAKQETAKLTEAKGEGNPLITPTKEWTGDWRSKLARLG